MHFFCMYEKESVTLHAKKPKSMQKNRVILWHALALFCLLSLHALAIPTYRNGEVQRLIHVLNIDPKVLHEGEQLFDVDGRKIRVVVARNVVQTVGFQLFTDEMKKVLHSPVPDFLERYFLQMAYPQSDRPRERMAREDRFYFKKGSFETVATLRPDYAFSLDFDHKRYQASWSSEDREVLTVTFPAVHELLSGENKQEAENNVEADMKNVVAEDVGSVDEAELRPTLQNDYLMKRGATYMNKLFSSDMYYHRQNDSLKLVADVSHPLESVANMMLAPDAQSALTLKVQQVLYGYKRKNFEVPLKNWVAYCRSNGCELYYGIESFENDEVKTTIIAVNEEQGYNHVLFLTIPVEVIDRQCGDMTGTLQAFIPMHNVKSLVAQYHKVEKRKRHYEP